MSFKRQMVNKLMAEVGLNTPTVDILTTAERIVEADRMYRFYKRLPTPKNKTALRFDFSYDIECFPNFFRVHSSLLIQVNVGYSRLVNGVMMVCSYYNF